MQTSQARFNSRTFILENTRIVSPLICPEIRLQMITDSCPLWYATEADLARLPIGDPYWGFCWAGGQALARYLLDHPEWVLGKRVVDFGTGCGIGAVAAALSGASSVLASDTDPIAVEAAQVNARLNEVEIEITTADLIDDPLSGFDLLIAGDMFYDPHLAGELFSWFGSLVCHGVDVLLADPSRGNLPADRLRTLAVLDAPADVDMTGTYWQKTTVYAVAATASNEVPGVAGTKS